MKIMSFNVLCAGKEENQWQLRIPLVVETIKTVNPDTLGVQEAHKGWIDALTDKLGDEYSYVGIGRDDGKEEGEYSAIFYKKNENRVIDSGSFWLSETPEVPSKGWDGVCIRICTWAVFENKNGKRFVHMNVHTDHVGIAARKNGATLMVEKARTFNIPVICTGDYNDTQGSQLYDIMTSDKLADAKYLAKDTMNGNTFHSFGNKEFENSLPIDHIFVSKENVKVKKFRIMNEKINGRFTSDHYAIYAEITI